MGAYSFCRTFNLKCHAHLRLTANRATEQLVVDKFDETHSHPLQPEIYQKYPEKRRVPKEEEEVIGHLLLEGVDTCAIKDYLHAKGQPFTTNQDLLNLKHRSKKMRIREKTEEEQMVQFEEIKVKKGKVLVEGKTKVVYELPELEGQVLLDSKDRITAGDGARSHELEGKAAISTTTTCAIFELLNNAGIKTHFIRKVSDRGFIARRCEMIPIEWVTRRIATGSFLKRHPGVKEGFRFCPPKMETFFKDDANNDPQWSREQVLMAGLKAGDRVFGADDYEVLAQTTVTVFEILERAWASLDCSLIDMKIEFGVCTDTGELVLADVVDSDSWRLWPAGDRRLMKDKQVYRELQTVTPEALETVKRNFAWVAERVPLLSPKPKARVVVIMGSPSDTAHCEKVRDACKKLGVPCELRVVSAHKATDMALSILHQYEGEGIPTVFVAVAGRSNGLGPVLSGNATWPVINCPPVSADWAAQDVWSSLRLPSGLGCGTVMSPEAAALNAAQILSLTDHVVWGRLRARKLNTWVDLVTADQKVRDDK